jgi:tetratricopeptide (TPR) repeat protein
MASNQTVTQHASAAGASAAGVSAALGPMPHAVLALEWVLPAVATPDTISHAQAHADQIIQQKCQVFGAQFERQVGRFVFLRVTHAPSATVAIETATQLALAIRRTVSQANPLPVTDSSAITLAVRIGIDLENPEQRDPICALPQRGCAGLNQVVISPQAERFLSTPYTRQVVAQGLQLDEALSTPLPALPSISQPVAPAENPIRSGEHLDRHAADANPTNQPGPDEYTADSGANGTHQPDSANALVQTTASSVESVSVQSSPHSNEPLAAVAATPEHPTLTDLESMALPQYWTITPHQPVETLGLAAIQQALQDVMSACLSHGDTPHDEPTPAQMPQVAGQLVVVSGFEGCGKTRLIQTALQTVVDQRINALANVNPAPAEAASPCFWLLGQSGPPFSPLALWFNLFAGFYQQVPLGLPIAELKAAIEGQPFLPDEFNAMWQTLMGYMIGSIQPEPLGAEHAPQPRLLAQIIYNWLAMLCQHQPVVMLLDDIDDADAASLDVVIDLLEMGVCRQLPVCMVLTHNAEVAPVNALAKALAHSKQLYLPVLSAEQAPAYLQAGPLESVWGQFPPHLVPQIVSLSQGNPLYIEEILRLLFLQGVLNPLTGPDLQLHCTDVAEVFAERWALLPPAVQTLAQWLAVLAYPVTAEQLVLFLPAAVTEAIQQADDALTQDASGNDASNALVNAMQKLLEHGIWMQDGAGALLFRHRLLQQWVYHTLPEAERHHAHQHITTVLEQMAEAERHVPFNLLAEQAELAGDLELAAHAWSGAGIIALFWQSLTGFNMAMIRAAQLFDTFKGSAHWPNVTDSYDLILHYLAQYNAQAMPQLAVGVLPEHIPADDPPEQLQNLLLRCTSSEPLGQFDEGIHMAQQALMTLETLPNTEVERLYLQAQWVKWLVYKGEWRVAMERLRQHVMPSLNEAPQQHPLHPLAWQDAYMAKIMVQLGQCQPELLDTLDLMLSHKYLQTPDVKWQVLMARVNRYQGYYGKALQTLTALSVKDPYDYLSWLLELMALHNELCQWEKALGLLALAKAKTVTSKWQQVQMGIIEGVALTGLGKITDAVTVLKRTMAQAMDAHYAHDTLACQLALCTAMIAARQWALAEQQLTLILNQAALPHSDVPVRSHYQATVLMAEVLRQQGKVMAAGRLLEPHWQKVTDSRHLPVIAQLAEAIGLFYKEYAPLSEQPQHHLNLAGQFLQRAKRLWVQMQHPSHPDRLDRLMLTPVA